MRAPAVAAAAAAVVACESSESSLDPLRETEKESERERRLLTDTS